MNTIALDSGWDLYIDGQGNLALNTGPSAIAQDVASAIATYLGEVFYNTTVGVPWTQILGKVYSTGLLEAKLTTAAMTVPGVAKARVVITSFAGRTVTGKVLVTTDAGISLDINF